MTREEALQHFQEKYVKIKSDEKIDELKKYYIKNKDELANGFIKSFKDICIKISNMQSAAEKDKIAYINYSILRTNIMDRKYMHLVDAFNKYWYFDIQECSTEYDTSWAFDFLEEFEKELEEIRKLYMNKISAPDIDKIKLKETKLYNQYIIDLAKYSMPEAIKLKEYKEIHKEDIVEIRVGEYRGSSELVYKEQRTMKNL
ncbi:hypothetical protein [Clostridium sp. DJ247]|uniref:hypothetical protein n=1 Tax=Clostridium sp. DJ247 TaxID=2726188 RepID=UPI001625240A|nr:hypothetical protein [Clostridium sp. DJ247]MBC2580532.1 hypothetical protein [Clostridium sp. DJ247]